MHKLIQYIHITAEHLIPKMFICSSDNKPFKTLQSTVQMRYNGKGLESLPGILFYAIV